MVGVLERFDETLLLISDLIGLQRLLGPAQNVAAAHKKAANATLLGCGSDADCEAQIAAAAPVDALMYAEVNASFAARVEAQGEAFALRAAKLRQARERAERAGAPSPLRYNRKKKKTAREIANEPLGRRQCIGLLAGEGDAAERLCRHFAADTQYEFAWRKGSRPADREHEAPQMMHPQTI